VAETTDAVTDGSLFNAVASFTGGTESARRRRPSGFEPYIGPDARPFLVNCRHCGEMFTPVPPDALCPHCGVAALSS
jgi:hypothetical protein